MVVTTDLSDTDLEDIIDEVDALIDWSYDVSSVPALVLQHASRLKTAITVMLRDPSSFRIGEYSEDRSKTIEKMNREADEALKSLSSGSLEAFNEPID